MPDRRPPHRHRKPAPGRPRRHDRPPRERAPLPDSTPPAPHPERLQKILAHAGVASRRESEELILQGRVTVDGKVVRELGTRVDPHRSEVALDGQPVRLERPVYFAVHKPKGYVSTNSDPAGRPRVVDLLPEIPQRVYTVGRLDEMSVGLMILTNDGELANKLAHPRYGVEKVYRAVVAGTPTKEVLDKVVQGVWLAEGKVRAKHVRVVGHKGESTVLEMVLAEGKNREVRRMLAKLGHKVMSLARVAVGPVRLKGLRPGEFRPLSNREVELLRKVAAGVPVEEMRRPPRPRRSAERRPARPAGPAQAATGPAQGPPRGPRRRPAGPPRADRPARPPLPPPVDQPVRRVIGLEDEGPPARPRPRHRPQQSQSQSQSQSQTQPQPERPRPPARRRRPPGSGGPGPLKRPRRRGPAE